MYTRLPRCNCQKWRYNFFGGDQNPMNRIIVWMATWDTPRVWLMSPNPIHGLKYPCHQLRVHHHTINFLLSGKGSGMVVPDEGVCMTTVQLFLPAPGMWGETPQVKQWNPMKPLKRCHSKEKSSSNHHDSASYLSFRGCAVYQFTVTICFL